MEMIYIVEQVSTLWGNSFISYAYGLSTGAGTSNITSEIASLAPQAVVMGWREVINDVDVIQWSKII